MEAVFTSSAFRHGYTKQDFYELLAADYLKIRSQRGLDEVYELLGRNLTRIIHSLEKTLQSARHGMNPGGRRHVNVQLQ